MFPFAGMVCEYPWGTTGLTTARWEAEVPVEWVEFRKLILTQDGVYFAKLFSEPPSVLRHPHVVVYQNVWYLEDGHHRCCRVALRGGDGMLMRVFKIDSKS
jgi:hypothetical protein